MIEFDRIKIKVIRGKLREGFSSLIGIIFKNQKRGCKFLSFLISIPVIFYLYIFISLVKKNKKLVKLNF
jgi:hypothetical protein